MKNKSFDGDKYLQVWWNEEEACSLMPIVLTC